MKRDVLNFFAIVGMVFATFSSTYGAGLKPTVKGGFPQKKTVQTVVEENKVDYMNSDYSRQELDEKLSKIYNGIEGNIEEVENVKRVLQKMSMYGIGQRTIMQMPEGVKIKIDNAGYLSTIEADGVYAGSENTILLPNDILDNDMQIIVMLSHEMRHAIQNADGRDRTVSDFPSTQHVFLKICEMETRLQDIVFESQLKQGTDEEKSASCLFYEAEIERYQKAGLSQKNAERAARTSVVQVYWSCLWQEPTGCSGKTQDLCDEVIRWNNRYAFQALVNNIKSHYREIYCRTPNFEIDKAEALEQQQAEYEEKARSSKRMLTIEGMKECLPTYLEEMDINLSENWFTKVQRERSTVGDNFIINYYPGGAKQLEIFLTPDKYTLREHSEPFEGHPDGVILHEVTFNTKGQKDGVEIYRYPNGDPKRESLFINGIENGIHKEYYDTGRVEVSIKNNKKHGEYNEFYKDGTPRIKGFYVDDKMNGLETFYWEVGRQETYYKDDEKLWIKEFDKDGNLVKETVYKDNNTQTNEEVTNNPEKTLDHQEKKVNKATFPDKGRFEY